MSAAVKKITRTQAAELIEEIRENVASGGSLASIAELLRRSGIEPLMPCRGQAHTKEGAFIDNCSVAEQRTEREASP